MPSAPPESCLAVRRRRGLKALFQEDRGQALAEYAVVVALCFAVGVAVYGRLPAAVMGYYRGVIHVVALPIP
ncbi:MAG: hypothetical protein HY722_08520 [Planctomycetes bacterium]|nr:hypothetical protein [Planctomycetota bacterium]